MRAMFPIVQCPFTWIWPPLYVYRWVAPYNKMMPDTHVKDVDPQSDFA